MLPSTRKRLLHDDPLALGFRFQAIGLPLLIAVAIGAGFGLHSFLASFAVLGAEGLLVMIGSVVWYAIRSTHRNRRD